MDNLTWPTWALQKGLPLYSVSPVQLFPDDTWKCNGGLVFHFEKMPHYIIGILDMEQGQPRFSVFASEREKWQLKDVYPMHIDEWALQIMRLIVPNPQRTEELRQALGQIDS